MFLVLVSVGYGFPRIVWQIRVLFEVISENLSFLDLLGICIQEVIFVDPSILFVSAPPI